MRTLCGALLWSLFLLLTLFLHGKEEKKRLDEYKALCHLVHHIKSTLLTAPVPLSLVYADFSDRRLDGAFLSRLQKEGLAAALAADTLSLEEEELHPFKKYAEELGRRLYTEELLAADELLSRVTATAAQKEAVLPQQRRLTSTLFFSGGMLILLLFL